RQRAAQRELADLLRQVAGVAAHHRAEGLAAAAELRCRLVAVAGATGALLRIHLLGRRRDLGAALGLVRALLAVRKLPHHAALQDVLADGYGEHRVGEVDFAGAAAFNGFDRDLHDLILKPGALRRPPALRAPRQQPCAGQPGRELPWDGRAWRRLSR